ncbi:MAG: response regulator [Lachnospiraceae bacterium]|nr:response regulator [Lachnospiraceae bacterium]
MFRILYVEDDTDKYMEVARALKSAGFSVQKRAITMEEALDEVRQSEKEGAPYDVVLSDMSYPLRSGEPITEDAGKMLLDALSAEGYDLPLIICSSVRCRTNGAYGDIWFSKLSSWERELPSMLKTIFIGAKG